MNIWRNQVFINLQGLNCHLFDYRSFFFLNISWMEFWLEIYSKNNHKSQQNQFTHLIFTFLLYLVNLFIFFVNISFFLVIYLKSKMWRCKHSVGIISFWSVKVSNVSFIIKWHAGKYLIEELDWIGMIFFHKFVSWFNCLIISNLKTFFWVYSWFVRSEINIFKIYFFLSFSV